MMRFVLLAQQSGNLSFLRFEQGGPIVSNTTISIIFVVLLVALSIVAGVFYVRNRVHSQTMLRERGISRLKALLEDLSLGEEDKEILHNLSGSDDPMASVRLLESRVLFETATKNFREAHPENKLLRRTVQLRQRLGYGFNNIRNPFQDTRMLAPGTKLQCSIPHPKRVISYLTQIVVASETHFFVRPPRAKGKPVSMLKFPQLTFKVSRDNDAEYEFTCKVAGQTTTGTQAVVLEHTADVHKHLFRHAPRVPVDIPTQFYIVQEESIVDKSRAALRAQDSQFVIRGKLRDISIGGAMGTAERTDNDPQSGDMIIFRLLEAQVKDDLVAQVLRTVPKEDGQIQFHLQFVGTKELDRLKLNRFINERETPPAGGGSGVPVVPTERPGKPA